MALLKIHFPSVDSVATRSLFMNCSHFISVVWEGSGRGRGVRGRGNTRNGKEGLSKEGGRERRKCGGWIWRGEET